VFKIVIESGSSVDFISLAILVGLFNYARAARVQIETKKKRVAVSWCVGHKNSKLRFLIATVKLLPHSEILIQEMRASDSILMIIDEALV
jgi:hypothetical protein